MHGGDKYSHFLQKLSEMTTASEHHSTRWWHVVLKLCADTMETVPMKTQLGCFVMVET